MGEYDYVIVGAGSAGCVLAARLSEDPDVSVCLLEAGPSDVGLDDVLQLRRWSLHSISTRTLAAVPL